MITIAILHSYITEPRNIYQRYIMYLLSSRWIDSVIFIVVVKMFQASKTIMIYTSKAQ